MTLHLSHEQLCDLILADLSLQPEGESWNDRKADSDVVHEHLRACLVCSAELRSLRDSLSHFRDASVSYARQEFAQSYAHRSSIAPPHSFLSQPLYWTAAAVVFAAALFPLSMHRQRPAPPRKKNDGSPSRRFPHKMPRANLVRRRACAGRGPGAGPTTRVACRLERQFLRSSESS